MLNKGIIATLLIILSSQIFSVANIDDLNQSLEQYYRSQDVNIYQLEPLGEKHFQLKSINHPENALFFEDLEAATRLIHLFNTSQGRLKLTFDDRHQPTILYSNEKCCIPSNFQGYHLGHRQLWGTNTPNHPYYQDAINFIKSTANIQIYCGRLSSLENVTGIISIYKLDSKAEKCRQSDASSLYSPRSSSGNQTSFNILIIANNNSNSSQEGSTQDEEECCGCCDSLAEFFQSCCQSIGECCSNFWSSCYNCDCCCECNCECSECNCEGFDCLGGCCDD